MPGSLPQGLSTHNQGVTVPDQEIPFWSYFDVNEIPKASWFWWSIHFPDEGTDNYLVSFDCILYSGIYQYRPLINLIKNAEYIFVRQCDYHSDAAVFTVDRAPTFTYPDILYTAVYNAASIPFNAAVVWNFYRTR